MAITIEQIKAVTRLEASRRYEHFIKEALGWRRVWTLVRENQALTASSDGHIQIGLWPAKEYALICTETKWRGFVPKYIRYGHLVKLVLPELGERGVVVNVFETPSNNGLIVSTDRLIADLKREREKYP